MMSTIMNQTSATILPLLFLLVGTFASMPEEDREARVKAQVPDLYHMIANIRRITRNAKTDHTKSSLTARQTQRIRSYIHNAREDYQRLKDTLHSALNLNVGNKDTFSLDLQQTGPNTKLDIKTPVGQVEVDTTSDKETSTEVPFTEYLQDLVEATYAPDLATSDDQTSEYASRKGDLADDDEIDPEEEYDELLQEQTMNYLKLRNQHMYGSGEYERRQGQSWPSGYDEDYVMNLMSRSSAGQIKEPQRTINQYNSDSSTEDDTYSEYINDLESQFGPINYPARIRIRNAFRQLKRSLEMINLDDTQYGGETLECQKSIFITEEGARSQVSQYEDFKRKRIVLAFTLTGVPIKLQLDADIEDPLEFLQQALQDVGLSLYVPVLSNAVFIPVGSEVVLVGACNRSKVRATELIPSVSYAADIRSMVDRVERLS